MNVKQLKEILATYPDDYLIVIDHVEGYMSPSLVQPIHVNPLAPDHPWKDYKGDYELATSEMKAVNAIHITVSY